MTALSQTCGFKLYGFMPPCVLPPGHNDDHSDGCGGHYTNDSASCLNCGDIHPECRTIGCHNPTHCPPDELGEPFTFCDSCDAVMADVDGSAVQS